MALNSPSTPRPDGTKQVTGNEGEVVRQEAVSGKQVYRKGGDADEADIDVGTEANPHDLDGGSNDFSSDNKNAGGAGALVMQVESDDSASFNIHVDWLDDEENVVITTSKAALQGVTEVEKAALRMRSDRFRVRIEDASGGQNRIHGSCNAH